MDDEDGEICEVDIKTLSEVKNQIKDLVCRVITHIRFPMMSPNQLASLLILPIVQEFKEFFVQRMAIGMSYHHGRFLYHHCNVYQFHTQPWISSDNFEYLY